MALHRLHKKKLSEVKKTALKTNPSYFQTPIKQSTMSHTIKTDYPVYGAQFFDNNTALIAGGGGEGNNGIPNKISVLSVDFARAQDKIKVVDEFELQGKNDSPTGLSLAGNTILIGANESSDDIKNGSNKHLRKFQYDADSEKNHIKFIDSADVEESKDPEVYQKLTAISANGATAAVVSSKIPSVLRIIDPKTLKVKESVELSGKEEINDIAINADGTKIAYITSTKLVVIQDGEKPTLSHEKYSKNYNLGKVEFTSNDDIIIGVNLRNGSGVLLLQSSIIDDEETGSEILKTKKARVITSKFRKITSLDISSLKGLIAISGNDNSIVITSLDEFEPLKTLKKIHSFAITKITFSPNGEYLLSTSAANTVNVYKIPANIKVSYKLYYRSFIVLVISYIIYILLQRVSPDQWEDFYETAAFLLGEEYTRPASTTTTTAVESLNTGTAKTAVEYQTEIVIKEGDIITVQTKSIDVADESTTILGKPARVVVSEIPEDYEDAQTEEPKEEEEQDGEEEEEVITHITTETQTVESGEALL